MGEDTDRHPDDGGVGRPVRVSSSDIECLGRIVDHLRGVNGHHAGAGRGPSSSVASSVGPGLLPIARLLLVQRSDRAEAFADCQFGEAVWDVMLHLYIAHHEKRQVGAYALAGFVRVPPSTALRWIATMENCGHFIRETDHSDRRRSLVTLAPAFHERLDAHLTAFRREMLAICTE